MLIMFSGAASYQLYLTAVGIIGLIYATVHVYGFIKNRMIEKKAALAAAKKLEKELAKKKTGRSAPK